MKNPEKIQRKLFDILKKQQGLKVSLNWPWTEQQFKEIAWVVKDYVDNSGDVTNDDPLHEWLEEYHFFLHQG